MHRRFVIQTAASLACCGAVSALSLSDAQTTSMAGGKTLVAAASDLKFALTDVVDQFERATTHRFALNMGSSGTFTQQIKQGLPAELFFSADEGYVFELADAGLTRDRGSLYAVGRVALFVPAASNLPLDTELKGIKDQWTNVTKFAIANPDHAPYGRAAQQALQKLGLWEMVRPKLVLGENISQATQFVSTGAAQVGITALSLALAQQVAKVGKHILLRADLHAPLRQRMVLMKNAGPAATALYHYLQTDQAQATLKKYGFTTR